MIDHATPVAPSDTRFGPDRTNFLTSHRAQSVGAREFSKLAESLVALAKRAAAGSASEPPITRLSPDRCIVQLGPVALTVAHIRTGNDVPPGGQLLAIIWNGTIAPAVTTCPSGAPVTFPRHRSRCGRNRSSCRRLPKRAGIGIRTASTPRVTPPLSWPNGASSSCSRRSRRHCVKIPTPLHCPDRPQEGA